MKKLILVIEDDSAILDSLKQLLEMEGFEVATAMNGQDGIDLLKASDRLPQLILLDLMMPIKDGFEFRNEQMENPKFASIPILVMTAEGHQSERKDRLKAKAILRKPLDIDQLIDVERRNCT